MRLEFEAADAGERLDVYLAEETGYTRSQVKKLLDERAVLLNGAAVKAGTRLRAGDLIICEIPEAQEFDLIPENIPLNIVYEDNCLAVINKPQGMVVHPAAGNRSGTLVNALLWHFGQVSNMETVRPGIVHRLDKLTSGLIVIAKTDKAHVSLSRQIAEKSAARIYHAVCEGVIKEDSGVVDRPIGRDPKDRKKMAVVAGGKSAVTHYRVMDRYRYNTYAEFRLETGRTHQIRVHAKSLGHPVTGDTVYGFKKQRFDLEGQLLHAKTLILTHPESGKRMEFSSDLPPYFAAVLKKLERERI